MSKKKKSLKKILYIIAFAIICLITATYYDTTITNISNNNIPVDSNLRIYFLDVGQADSILVVNDDKTMLIDAGNNQDGKLIVDYLKSLGITKIDYLIGTHPHEDHIGGLDNVINSFDIGIIYMPKVQTNTKTFEDVLDAVSNKNMTITAPNIGDKFNVGECECTVMYVDNNAENLNSSSIVIRMTFGNQSYLFIGDIEEENEKDVNWPKTNVLKVAHHGSNTSSSKDFLNSVSPEIAIISVGEDNSYGHPTKTILNRLKSVGATIYRTDTDGTILLTSDGKNNNIEKLNVSLDGNKE